MIWGVGSREKLCDRRRLEGTVPGRESKSRPVANCGVQAVRSADLEGRRYLLDGRRCL